MKAVLRLLIGLFTKKHSWARRSLLAVPLTFFFVAAAGSDADAAPALSVCMPPPGYVPGLPGPPDWLKPNKWNGNNSNDWINDPRWTGALSLGYVNGTAFEVNFRAVSAIETISPLPAQLYLNLSWNVRVSPSQNADLYVGFFPEDSSQNPTRTGYVLNVTINQNSTCPNIGCPSDSSTPGTPPYAPPLPVTNVTVLQATSPNNPNNWVTPNSPPSWLSSVKQYMRISKLPGNPYTWNVEMKIPPGPSPNGLDLLRTNSDTKFLFWYDVKLNTSAGPIDYYDWPRGPRYLYGTGAAPPNLCGFAQCPPNPFAAGTGWGEINLKQLFSNPADCPHGNVVSLDNSWQSGPQVGTKNNPDDKISYDGKNVFFAKPTNTWSTTNGAINAGQLKVSIRIADWGSVADPNGSVASANAPWTLLQLGSDPNNLQTVVPTSTATSDNPLDLEFLSPNGKVDTTWDLSNPPPLSQACRFRCEFFVPPANAGPCNCTNPVIPHNPTGGDQCMLVTLSGDVDISPDSVSRNMSFAKTSKFERDAQINLVGLPALGTPTRDVYLFLEKQNMPGFPTIINGTPTSTAALSANPASISSDQSSTLSWSSTNATSCTGTSFSTGNASSGSATLTPLETTTYSVTCTNGSTSATASATVTVNPIIPSPSVPVPKLESKTVPNGAEKLPAPTTSLDPSVQLTKLLPTYVVHVYHDTGRKTKVNGVDHPVLEPQGSFGYFMQHQGLLFGWDTALESVTPGLLITQIAPDFYKLSGVPDGGKVMIKTKIDTIDLTTWWIWLILILFVLVLCAIVAVLRRVLHI
jgi:hypothetical protein